MARLGDHDRAERGAPRSASAGGIRDAYPPVVSARGACLLATSRPVPDGSEEHPVTGSLGDPPGHRPLSSRACPERPDLRPSTGHHRRHHPPRRTAARRALFTAIAVRSAVDPASPRKSQTKSQRRPTSGDAQRRQATVEAGQVPTERHRATSSDAQNVTGGQGVAGSNPAVPTGNQTFSNKLPLRKSQQKSQLVVQRPLHRPAPRARHGAPPRHVPRQQNRQAHQSRRQRSLSHPGSARRPRTTANRPAHPPAHPLTTGRTLTGIPQLHDAGKPGVLKPGLLTPPWTRRPPA